MQAMSNIPALYTGEWKPQPFDQHFGTIGTVKLRGTNTILIRCLSVAGTVRIVKNLAVERRWNRVTQG